MSETQLAPPTEPEVETTQEAPNEGPSLLDNMYGSDQPSEPEADEQQPVAEPGGGEAGEPEPVAAEPGGDDGQAETVSTLSELLESQEWDSDWFDGLKVPIKVDHQTTEVAFKDLVSNYRQNSAADKRLEEVKAKITAANDEIAAKNDESQRLLSVGSKLIKHAEDTLQAEMGAVDWASLKEEDPAEYSAKKIEFQERRDALEQAKAEARSEIEQLNERAQQEAKLQHREYLAQENQLLLEAIPEWQDDKIAQSEKAELARFLIGQGFTEDDVNGAADHRLIVVARKAMLFDQMKASSDAPKKRVVKTPKVLKPGTKTPKDEKEKPQDRVSIMYPSA